MYHTALQSTALRYPGCWADRGEACSSKLEQAAREDPSVDCGITSESIPISITALETDMDKKLGLSTASAKADVLSYFAPAKWPELFSSSSRSLLTSQNK